MAGKTILKSLVLAALAAALLGTALVVGSGSVQTSAAEADVPNPSFTVWLPINAVHGYEWPEGVEVTLTINDPDTPDPVDYADSQTVGPAPWNPEQTFVEFDLGAFDAEPGHVVTLTDGVTAKTHIIRNLAVTGVDVDLDTVSGTAEPFTEVWVDACEENDCVNRHEVADGAGDWTADFSVPGDEPGEDETFDLGPGNDARAQQYDDDGDSTVAGWVVPNPRFWVSPLDRRVDGVEWPLGAEVTLTIDDPGTPGSPDYSDSQTVEPDAWNPESTWVAFELDGAFEVQPGHVVTLTDGSTTKEHTVTNLALIAVDPAADTVSGTAAPGTDIEVHICDEAGCVFRYEVADGAGHWTADFSVPGDEQGEEPTYNLVPGSEGEANQWDHDGDGTHVHWRVPNPSFTVWLNQNQVHGYQWTDGVEVALTINDPDTPDPVDYADSQTVGPAPWNPEQTFVEFDLGAFDAEPGHVVTLTDGVTAKTHIIRNLAVTGVDVDLDTVSGTAEPFTDVGVWVHTYEGSYCAGRTEVADEFGQWTADFSVPGDDPGEEECDIVPGGQAFAKQDDDDGDATSINWNVPNPSFTVWLNQNQVHGYQWTDGVEVALTIDDPGTPDPVDYSDSQTVGPAPWDPEQTFVFFDLQEAFAIQPGHVVSLSDGVTTKTHTVRNLAVTGVDADLDTVSGTAEPFTEVWVNACGQSGCVNRHEDADEWGEWNADFSVPGDEPGEEPTFDLVPGSQARAGQYDDDGDATSVAFTVEPYLGDANGDGKTSMVDAMLAAQCVVGLIDCNSIDQEMADVNCSGGVSMVDAMLIAQKVVGLITDFPCSLLPPP